MNPADAVPAALLLLFGAAVGIFVTIVLLASRWQRQTDRSSPLTLVPHHPRRRRRSFPTGSRQPATWLAIRSRDPARVLAAFALNDPEPCSWNEGFNCESKLFIAPAIRGWVLVVGAGVPDPAEDVDACFRFLQKLSRQFGQVQWFHADPLLRHHAWARMEGGRVLRAYAWAGMTLWNQGPRCAAEMELRLACFDYGDDPPASPWGIADVLSSNVEKVPRLAARWSLGPAELESLLPRHARGIAGTPSARF